MPGIPLKSGADFYVLEAARMRLHNLGADPTEYGDGLIYFNNSDGNNTSRRARIYDGTTFRSLAFLDEIANNEAFNALVGRVDEAEGDITSLEGRATSLEGRATATEGNLSTLKARVDAFLDGGVDSDAVLENLKEIQAFLDAYDGATSLAEMFDAVNTQIADRYTKAEADGRFLKLTGGTVNGDTNIIGLTMLLRNTLFPLYVENTSPTATGAGIRFRNNGVNTIGLCTLFNTDFLYRYNRDVTKPYIILDEGNYSDLITTLNKTLSVPSITIGGINLSVVDGRLQIDGNAYATGELAAGGAGEEGSDDMGLALLENWADYDATKAQALGAVLGKDMYDRIVTLEGKSTNVQFTPTLSSGKQIGAITIDGVTTGIFAPSSYAWSEIDGRPTSLSQFTDDVVAGNYLPLTGGSINGNLLMTGGHLVTHELYAGVDNTYDLGNLSRRWANIHTMLINGGTPIHSGNIGSYKAGDSDKLGGLSASSFVATKSITEDINATDLYGSSSFVLSLNSSTQNVPSGMNSGEGIYIAGYDTGFMLLSSYTQDKLMYRRGTNSIGSNSILSNAWKTIAFTDSDITGNADTATRLATPRTIWGQSFDGTDKVDGALYIPNNTSIYMKNADGTTSYSVMYLSTSNALVIGNDHAYYGYSTLLSGNEIRLRYGTSRTNGLILNSNGNVTIGASDLAGSDYKLYVSGKGLFTNTITANAGINLANRTYIGGMLTDGTTNALLLGINQSDAFLVGYGVMKAAQTSIYGKSITLHANGEAVSFRINEYGNVTLGASTDMASDTYGLYVGKALPSYFANRVLIGGTDDGSTRFQVNGTSAFGGQSTFNALALFNKPIVAKDTLQIGDATLSWDADKNALKVDKNIYSDGEVSAGGAGEEGEPESTGNASAWAQTFTPTNTTMPFEHNRATTDVIVQVFEKNDGGSWDMILVDVEIISETKVNLHFGRTENREHKIVIMG